MKNKNNKTSSSRTTQTLKLALESECWNPIKTHIYLLLHVALLVYTYVNIYKNNSLRIKDHLKISKISNFFFSMKIQEIIR